MKQALKKKVSRRLNITQGQLRGLIKMVEGEKYCVDIITQSNALKEALSAVDNLILQNHLETHVLHQIKTGKEKKAIVEILKIYNLAQRKK